MKKTALVFFLLVGGAAAVFLLLRPAGRHEAFAQPAVTGIAPGASRALPLPPGGGGEDLPGLQQLGMAKDLNAPGRTIRDDLIVLDGVFLAYQSNVLKEGNPVGTNSEITAALTGRNSLGLAFLSPRHPAINAAGELCDRWGTPFFFHQVNASRMELFSAGPDRERGTADDVTIE